MNKHSQEKKGTSSFQSLYTSYWEINRGNALLFAKLYQNLWPTLEERDQAKKSETCWPADFDIILQTGAFEEAVLPLK